MNPQSLTPQSDIHHPLSVMQSGEQIICEIKRHPIGLFGIFISSGLLIILVAIFCFVLAPNMFKSLPSSEVTIIGAVIFIALSAFMLAFAFVANKIYWGNSWVITSDSITQYSQTGLFVKQSSQLSLGNLEDITAEQNGILAHIFNYGVLRAESAGERSKFFFIFCPKPNYYAQQALDAREKYMQGRREANEAVGRGIYKRELGHTAILEQPNGMPPIEEQPITNPEYPTNPQPGAGFNSNLDS